MDDNLVKAGDAGEPTAIFFKFLHVAFAVGGADDEDVITCCIGRSFRIPKRPREIAAGIINLGVTPGLAVIKPEFNLGNAAVGSVSHALDFDWSVQSA